MEFVYLPQFVKKLMIISKKYPSLNGDIEKLLEKLRLFPQLGKSLGKDCFKIRLAIKSKGQGKAEVPGSLLA